MKFHQTSPLARFLCPTSVRPRQPLSQARRHFDPHHLHHLHCCCPRLFSTDKNPTTAIKRIADSFPLRNKNDSRYISSRLPFFVAPISTVAMASSNVMDQLAQRVEGLTVASVTELYPNAHPEINPLDLYRAHLTDLLSKASGVDKSIIYPVVMWTQSLDKGDFVVAVPALRIKGTKPDVLAQEWAAKVRLTCGMRKKK